MTDNHVNNESFSRRQRLFTRYTMAILLDLAVLSLFNEYWDYVLIDAFSISLLAAILLQFLLQVTIRIEHAVANYFKEKPGLKAKILRGLSTWGILFFSKLIILEIIDLLFGDRVAFGGPIHGLVAFIVVVTAIIIVEQIFLRIYRSLA